MSNATVRRIIGKKYDANLDLEENLTGVLRVTVALWGTARNAEPYVVVTSKSRKLNERKRIQEDHLKCALN